MTIIDKKQKKEPSSVRFLNSTERGGGGNVILVGDFAMARAFKKNLGYFPVKLFNASTSKTLAEIIRLVGDSGEVGNFAIIDELDSSLSIDLEFVSRGVYRITTHVIGSDEAPTIKPGIDFVLSNRQRRYRLAARH